MHKISHCKGCGAEIIWGITSKNEKRQPLDHPPEKRIVIVGHTPDMVPIPITEVVDTYVAHHATCPDVEKFR